MPKNNEVQRRLYDVSSYSLKIEGVSALLRKEVVTQDVLLVGDKVQIFSLPDGNTFVSKVDSSSESAYTVGRITPAHIYFDDDIVLKEK